MTVGCGLAVLLSSIILFYREVNESMHDKVNVAKTVVEHEIERMKAEAHIASLGMANSQNLVEALESGNRIEILKTAQDLLSMTSLDYCTIRGNTGHVIAMTHDPEYYGESTTNMPHIESAYAGRTNAHLVKGLTIPLAVSAGTPVYNNEGNFLGVIALGYRFDNQDLVRFLKDLTGCEITFFLGDERISSTLLNEDGTYALGTQATAEISEHVLGGETYVGRTNLFGKELFASYSPLIDIDGEVLGMVFTGYYTAEEMSKVMIFAIFGVLITLGVFILCIILAKIISSQIERSMASLAVYKDREHETAYRYEYSKKLADTLAIITKSPDIPAGDIRAAAEIIAREACQVLNVHRISIWSLSDAEDALVNITCYERSTGDHAVHDDFDLLERASYADLLRSERLIITSNIHESASVDDGYNPDICAMLEAPIRLDGKFIGLVCADLDRCDEFPEEREWLTEEQNFVSSLADLMALAISGFERRKSRDDAEMANQAKSTFLANMSHEIRTPMNSILGVTDILLQKDLLPDDIEEGLSRIYTSSDMLLGIINDILDFSKIEAGKLDIIPAIYKTAGLINDSVLVNMTRVDDKPIEFEVQIDENLPAKLLGDELRIKQIINNLLSNAFKFTETGKVTLSIVSELLLKRGDVTLVLIVRDTGRGMNEKQLSNLFDEYIRFEDDSNVKIEGTGLGLAITQRLIGLMNGGIHVESEPGVGSMFAVRLPQRTVDDDVIGKEVADQLQRLRTNYVTRSRRGNINHEPMPYGSVLVVDDFESNLYVAKGLMKPYGLKIDVAMSGQEAIDKVSSGIVYDIIFMDHMMPEMNGMEATARLRKLGYGEPIIALTANVVEGQADIFLQNGFDAFISKPVDIRQLDAILNKLIRDKQSPEIIEVARKQAEKSADSESVDEVSIEDVFVTQSKGTSRVENRVIDGLDIAEGLNRYGNDEEQYLRVLRSYMSSVRSVLDTIEVFDESNIYDFEVKVHGIKGASLDILAISIGEEAGALEDAAKAGDINFIKNHHPAFIEASRKLIGEIDELFSALNAENPRPVKEKPEREKLVRLLSACKEYNLDEADAVMVDIDKFQYVSDGGLVDWLRENVDLMNYSQIAERLSDYETS